MHAKDLSSIPGTSSSRISGNRKNLARLCEPGEWLPVKADSAGLLMVQVRIRLVHKYIKEQAYIDCGVEQFQRQPSAARQVVHPLMLL